MTALRTLDVAENAIHLRDEIGKLDMQVKLLGGLADWSELPANVTIARDNGLTAVIRLELDREVDPLLEELALLTTIRRDRLVRELAALGFRYD